MAEKQVRKRKHFIAVLGTGGYFPCTYFFDEQTHDTQFVQEAVLKLACGELKPEDRITICLTEEARRQNWEDRAYSQWEIDNHRGTAEENHQGLHSALKRCLSDIPDIQIEEKDIATGKNSREIAQMFSEIYEVINEEEEIYFDITHGLRNIPMLVLTILEYAKVTKNISVGGIYYGAFEVGTPNPETNKKMVPIFDLSFYHTILSWSNAANSFIQYGHADEIHALIDEKWKLIDQPTVKKQDKKELSGNLNNVANCLQKFTASIETGRGNVDYNKGIRKCYEEYKSQQKMISERLVEEYYPFKELLDKVDQKMEHYKNAKTNLEIGMATIDWCIDNHMVQQGYTALEETIKTFLCEKINVSQDEEFWREMVVKRLCSSLYYVINKEPKVLTQKLEEWKEYLQTNAKCNKDQMQEGLKNGQELFKLIIGKQEHKKLISLMDRVGKKRNDISHFGLTNNTAKAVDLKKQLETMTNEFKEILKAWDGSETDK